MSQTQIDLESAALQICKQKGLQFGELVGTGGFKQVFRVEDANGTQLALKVLSRRASSARTAREIEALRRCNHPNIAKLLHIDQSTFAGVTFDYMLEEFLSGGTLGKRLQTHGALNREEVLVLGKPLISVLVHLYDLGLVHRDIKPDNIMYSQDGLSPVLVDFGIVRDLSAVSITKTFLPVGPGTPYFASPEQLNNAKGQTNWRSDQFSLGVMLYYCCLGVHPYQFPSDQPGDDMAGIERVVTRQTRSIEFYTNAKMIGLPCLIKMTEPWPINRFRTPDQLATAWAAQ